MRALRGVLIALCLQVGVARAHEPAAEHITETDGPAFSAGIGMQYALLGAQAGYYYQLDEQYRLAPYLSLGIVPAADDRDHVSLGWTLGVMGSWGHKHRLLIDLSFGVVGKQTLRLHDQFVDSRLGLAPGVGIGYEYMTYEGFFFRVAVGVAYLVSVPIYSASERFAITLTPVGVGLKVW